MVVPEEAGTSLGTEVEVITKISQLPLREQDFIVVYSSKQFKPLFTLNKALFLIFPQGCIYYQN